MPSGFDEESMDVSHANEEWMQWVDLSPDPCPAQEPADQCTEESTSQTERGSVDSEVTRREKPLFYLQAAEDLSRTISQTSETIVASPSIRPDQDQPRRHSQETENHGSSAADVIGNSRAQASKGSAASLPSHSRHGYERQILQTLAPKGSLSLPCQSGKPQKFEFVQYGTISPPRRQPKRKHDKEEKEAYGKNRKAGACAWCAPRKVQCPEGERCLQCQRKGIPAELCCRKPLDGMESLSPIGLARRFVDSYQGSIEEWSKDCGLTIDIWHGFGEPLTITVHEYVPKREIVDLFWKSPTGWQHLQHKPYGLSMWGRDIYIPDLHKYATRAIPSLLDQISQRRDPKSQYFVSTMKMALAYSKRATCAAKHILDDTFLLWSYVFMQYHALWRAADREGEHDTLGMAQLVLHSHDVQTLTPFHGTIPLPRLLHQQIHATIEHIMARLDRRIVSSLSKELSSFRRRGIPSSEESQERALGLYFVVWMYLSILEEVQWDAGRWENLLSAFDWPLEQIPSTKSDMCAFSARVVVAHYNSAMQNKTIWDFADDAKRGQHPGSFFLEEAHLQKLRPHGIDIQSIKDACFDNNDIRSLELKFSSLLLPRGY